MRKLLAALAVFAALIAPASAQLSMTGVGGGFGAPTGAGCSQATAFLARGAFTGGETTAITTFICGGVTDGWITGNLGTTGCGAPFDAIWILSVSTTAKANLNVCGTTFTLTNTGSATFTAGTGYSGNASTMFVDTGYNANTITGTSTCGNGAAACNYAQSSAHISFYTQSNRSTAQPWANMGAETSAVVAMKGLSYDPFGPNAWVAQANTNTSQAESDTAPGSGNAKGHFISNRVAVNSVTTALFDTGGPYNCSAGGCTTNASAFGVPNANFYLLGDNVSGTLSNASGDAISLASAGGGLSSTVKTQFAARANQLMIDIGAPYHY